MTIYENCGGPYLQYKGKYYTVCNKEKVASFSNGTKVKASFRKIRKCDAVPVGADCLAYTKSEGWIEVLKIE